MGMVIIDNGDADNDNGDATKIKQMCSVPSSGEWRGGGVGRKEAKTFENYKTAGAWGDSC